MSRRAVVDAKRVVVKVGSSSLTTAAGGLDAGRLAALVDVLAAVRRRGAEVVLVSSGAIAAGLAPLGLKRRPRALPAQQAAASVGQGLLVHRYTEELARHGIVVGQVLLTVDDVTRRSHYRNAHQTFAKLLELGVLPIVNENDTVATTEIRFGDNDRLAALVAHIVHADLLVLLSDVDGLYDANPTTRSGHARARDLHGRRPRRRTRRLDRSRRTGLRRHGHQGRVGPDRHRRRHPGGADLGRQRRGRAGRRTGRHAVPRDRPAPAHPPAVVGPRHRPARPPGARRRGGAGRGRTPRLAARRRRHRCRGRLRGRRPGRPHRPRRPRRWPAVWSTSTPPSCRRCSDAPRTTSSASSGRPTSARSCTATTWCCLMSRARAALLRSEAEEAEDHYWERLVRRVYDCFDPAGMAEFFGGFERPWWVVGGWAIEAFTGAVRRESTRTSTSRSWCATCPP